jgi:hypothetical protein
VRRVRRGNTNQRKVKRFVSRAVVAGINQEAVLPNVWSAIYTITLQHLDRRHAYDVTLESIQTILVVLFVKIVLLVGQEKDVKSATLANTEEVKIPLPHVLAAQVDGTRKIKDKQYASHAALDSSEMCLTAVIAKGAVSINSLIRSSNCRAKNVKMAPLLKIRATSTASCAQLVGPGLELTGRAANSVRLASIVATLMVLNHV